MHVKHLHSDSNTENAEETLPTSLMWPDPFSCRALSIRDDKHQRKKGLVQVQFQLHSDTLAQAQGVNKYF